jgi:hypothetical protein
MRRAEALRRFQAGALEPPRRGTLLALARELVASRAALGRARR